MTLHTSFILNTQNVLSPHIPLLKLYKLLNFPSLLLHFPTKILAHVIWIVKPNTCHANTPVRSWARNAKSKEQLLSPHLGTWVRSAWNMRAIQGQLKNSWYQRLPLSTSESCSGAPEFFCAKAYLSWQIVEDQRWNCGLLKFFPMASLWLEAWLFP